MKYLTAISLIILIGLATAKLQTYNADLDQTTASGISAGAYMAVQFQIAYSKHIKGVGVVGGGPFFCAQGNAFQAVGACMKKPNNINLAALKKQIQKYQNNGLIDDLSNLKKANVYLYSGSKDTEVKPQVVKLLQEQLESLGVENIQTQYTIPSQHAWITSNYGNECDFDGYPYINNCHVDIPKDILEHIYGEEFEPVEDLDGNPDNYFTFDQTPYGKRIDSLSNEGFIYVPTSCQNGEKCRVHIGLSGCVQKQPDIKEFVYHSGLNGYAEANNIIVLYPQVKKSRFAPQNPMGCFDWWGYTQSGIPMYGQTYPTKKGSQMQAIWKMVEDLTGSNSTNEFAF